MISCTQCRSGQTGANQENATQMRVVRIKYAGPQVQRTYECQTCGATQVITLRLQLPPPSSQMRLHDN
jgi:hypothetical protein